MSTEFPDWTSKESNIDNNPYRGPFDASFGIYPVSGGTFVGGNVEKGNFWIVSVAGVIGGKNISEGDQLLALVDLAGQISSNWQVNASSNVVTTVFGRIGNIIAENNDYNISQITNGLSKVLNSAQIFVGNSTSVAENRTINGDIILEEDGHVNVVAINNVKLDSLQTGILKNTNLTGIPTIANSSDIISTIGFTPEPQIIAGNTMQYWRGDKTFQVLNTSVVPELTNLYFTQSRFDTSFAAKSTTNLLEGTNLYYTQSRFDSAFFAKSTTNLIEGTNLYFTNSRVLSSTLGDMSITLNLPIATSDSVELAFLKAQGQIDFIKIGAALTRTDDTNVTLTLAGNSSSALLKSTSMTLGWQGFLSKERGGNGVDSSVSEVSMLGLSIENLTENQAVVTDSFKNLSSLAFSSLGGSSNLVSRDENGSTFFNNILMGNDIYSDSSTISLTASSKNVQEIRGSVNKTFTLPNSTTLQIGHSFTFINNSSGVITINLNSNTLFETVQPQGFKKLFLEDNSISDGVWISNGLIPISGVEWGQTLSITSTIKNAFSSNIFTGFNLSPVFSPPLSLSRCYSLFIDPKLNTDLLSISEYSALTINQGSLVGSGSVLNSYGAIIKSQNFGTNRTALYADNISVGFLSITPPLNGINVSGRTVLGSSSNSLTSRLTVSMSVVDSSCISVIGTQSIQTGGSGLGVSISTNLGTTAGKTIALSSQLNIDMNYNSNAGILTEVYGLRINAGNTAGTVTNSCGLRVALPAAGTSKLCARFEGIVRFDGILANGTTAVQANANTSPSLVANRPPYRYLSILANDGTPCFLRLWQV